MFLRSLRFVILLLPLVFLACTEEEEAALRRLVFGSEDGLFKLEVPRDIWSEDGEIKITPVPLDQLPDPLKQLRGAGVGYRIEPAGLTFSKPVKAVWQMEISDLAGWPSGGADMYGLGGTTSGGERQLLTDLETRYTIGASSATVSGKFSGGLDYIGRTRSSLSARAPEFAMRPQAGLQFQGSYVWRNSDESGNVTLSALSAEYAATGAVPLEGKSTATSGDLASGEQFTDQRDFKCGEAGAGATTMGLSATSLVTGMQSVPLRLTIEQPIDCAEEGAEPSIDLPQNLIDYFGPFSIKGTDLLNVHYTEDATNDHIYADPSKPAGFTRTPPASSAPP